MSEFEDLEAAMTGLVGELCWGVVGGGGASGSSVCLEFGGKRKRGLLVDNPTLDPEVQRNLGEWSLCIWSASWRLESGGSVLCDSSSSSAVGGELGTGIAALVGRRVVGVALGPRLDFIVEFSRVRLYAYCDYFDSGAEENYSLTVRASGVEEKCFSAVTQNGRVLVEVESD